MATTSSAWLTNFYPMCKLIRHMLQSVKIVRLIKGERVPPAQNSIRTMAPRSNRTTQVYSKKVTQAIIQRQLSFLELGPEHIEPLKMLQIAEVVGVDVSTISRAVDDKWVQTPRGVFPLKRFFGGGTQSATGEDIAWEKSAGNFLKSLAQKINPIRFLMRIW